jgi:hypothetical protein
MNTGSMTMVSLPDGNTWRDVTDKSQVEEAYSTSLPLSHKFGFKGLTPQAEYVLHGFYSSPYPLDLDILEFLYLLEMPLIICED